MSKLKLSLLLLIMSAVSFPAMAGERVVKRVPASAVAFHFVFDLSFGTGEFVGYLAFIEGVDASLFAGDPSKDTAYFTVRITKPVPNIVGLLVDPDPFPNLSVSLLEPGTQFTVFYNASPEPRIWSDAETFSQGVPIAVFEESALLNTSASGTFGTFPGIFFNLFSSSLIDSTSIDFEGQKLDFKKLVPNGVTVTNFGNAIRATDYFGASGAGTAIAIGGNPGDKSKHRD